MIDCNHPNYVESRKVVCNKCGGQIAFYWDHLYWCGDCGKLHSLVKLIKNLIVEIKFLQVKISKKTQDEFHAKLSDKIISNAESIDKMEKRVTNALSTLVKKKVI